MQEIENIHLNQNKNYWYTYNDMSILQEVQMKFTFKCMFMLNLTSDINFKQYYLYSFCWQSDRSMWSFRQNKLQSVIVFSVLKIFIFKSFACFYSPSMMNQCINFITWIEYEKYRTSSLLMGAKCSQTVFSP